MIFKRVRPDRLAVALAAAAVGLLYGWLARVPGDPWRWNSDANGYYNHLGRAFAAGRLHLDIQPSARLLALPNPYDPSVPDDWKMHDMVLFGGRYYLYHGPTPALIAFAPYRLATGHDLPESFAVFAFCWGGFLLAAAAMLRLWDQSDARPGAFACGLLALFLGLGPSVPYLLRRVWVYEVAIGCGWFCVAGAVYCFIRAGRSRCAAWWLAASGAMFALGIGCRPHLAFAGAIFFAALIWRMLPEAGLWRALSTREAAAFSVPFALGGVASAMYNFLRFGSPFEFGLRYLLAGVDQNRLRIAPEYLAPGLYFFLLCAPRLSSVFPWVEGVFRYPFDTLAYRFPRGYFIETITGALWLAPLLPLGFALPPARLSRREGRIATWAMVASACALLLFLASTGFTTQRYEVDFLPLAVLAASVNAGLWLARLRPGLKRLALIALTPVVAWSVLVNLALGLAGPYDEYLKSRPRNYVRLAGMLTFGKSNQLALNPAISVSFAFTPETRDARFREPLVSMGHSAYRWVLAIEHTQNGRRLTARAASSSETYDLGPLREQYATVRYVPEEGAVTVELDGRIVLRHGIGTLVSAPSEVRVGAADSDNWLTVTRFTGEITRSAVGFSVSR